MTRVAAVDCGTNTIRLLVSDVDPVEGNQHDVLREMRIVRLGQDVDRTGRLADAALDRVFSATDEYAALIREHRAGVVRFVATSAARDADNADVFTDGIKARLGVVPEVISGDLEAQLSYDGATRSLPEVPSPVAVVDIGGGSTEVIVGEPAPRSAPRAHGRVRGARSLDIGSVRLTERLMPSDPPTQAELEAATRLVDEALDTLPAYGVHLGEAATVVGVAGTVTTLGALLVGLRTWDRERVHHSTFSVSQVHELVERLLGMTVEEREAIGVPPGRSDVIGAGALILDRVLGRSGSDRLLVSDSDILDGIAWSIA